MRRRRRLTKNQRKRIAYDEKLAEGMEKALAVPTMVSIDLETMRTKSGRMSSSKPNLASIRRLGADERLKLVLREFAANYPGLTEYFNYLLPSAKVAEVPPSLLAAETDYASIERRLLHQMLSDGRAWHDVLLLSMHGEYPLAKMLGLDEEELRKMGEEAVVAGRASTERARGAGG